MASPVEQFLLFGDSITQQSGGGFAGPLQDAYIRRLDVVNRGFSGYNTKMALKVLPNIIPSPDHARIRFLFIFFGANDASLPDAPNRQHVPIDDFKHNLETIVEHPLIVAHKPRIILVAPPPLNEHAIKLAFPNEKLARVAATTKAYADATCEVGVKLGVPVINLWTAFMARAGWTVAALKDDPLPGSMSLVPNDALAELLSDGLHFTSAGYKIVFEEVMKVIAEKWPDQLPESLQTVFPLWNDKAAWDTFDAVASGTQS
ncbi:SGNH hydrolase [Pleomassaria siparia CBS 279.74]|uniref:SGNH hydrolase n=1 Tax=Pleomassaria siparia CBS 279.74 TaxID=1314801 RepID=A0A6G1KPX9_9PLEO|nr:SGNH hydrolase [Pleomassaria siparia CBS 279.74]